MIDWLITNIKYMVISIIFIGIVINIPGVHNFITQKFMTRVDMIFNYNSYEVKGGNERLSIVSEGMKNRWFWLLGTGIGAWEINTGGYLNFEHFGLSNIGSFTTLGGVWLYIAFCLFYSNMLKNIYNKGEENRFVFMIFFDIILVLKIYTVIYTSPVLMIWLCLILYVLGLCKDKELNEEK